jgi:hypothetical protein
LREKRPGWWRRPGSTTNPHAEAAVTGTRKVIAEHSTIGLVITTDGTITEIPVGLPGGRGPVISELKALESLSCNRQYRENRRRGGEGSQKEIDAKTALKARSSTA